MIPSKKTTAAVGLALAAFSLAIPAAAQAAPTAECDSGMLVAPSAGSTQLYPSPVNDGTFDVPASNGLMTTSLCAATGVVIPAESDVYKGSLEVVMANGVSAFARESSIVLYPAVDPAEITDYAASRDSQANSLLAKAGESRPHVYATPSAGIQAERPLLELEPGEVIRTTPAITALGFSKLAEVTYQPVLLTDGDTVGWVAADTVEALPAADAPLGDFKLPAEGFLLFDNPSDASPRKELREGDLVRASAPAGGWMRSSDGWVKAPVGDGEKEASELLATAQEKAAGAWDKTKEKASNLKKKALEKVEDSKSVTEKSRTLTLPAMVLTLVLSGLALILTVAGLALKPARGLRRFTPSGVIRTALSFLGVPVSLVLGMAAMIVAPAVWSWALWFAVGAAILAAVSMASVGSRIRGGGVHPDLTDAVPALRSPMVLAVGTGVIAVGLGGAILFGGSWMTYVATVLAGVSSYAGAALVTGRRDVNGEPDLVAQSPVDPADLSASEAEDTEPAFAE